MKFISTRGLGATDKSQAMDSAEAIIRGLAPDGGLYVPEELPRVPADFAAQLAELDYARRARRVLSLFLTDYTEEEIAGCIDRAYSGKFDDGRIAPVKQVGGKSVLELWHGPTSAFKDMALQLLPQLLSTALKKTGEKNRVLILVATSGDTGKAALAGFADVDQTKICVFYPDGGVSDIQRLQMATQKGENVAVLAIKGNFDDAQTGVKKIFGDEAAAKELAETGVQLSSANSINWGRLVPQIVYYFSAYADLIAAGRIKAGDTVDFTVPTGNFGNILAGFYARQMGLPVGKLVCASNANNVLTDFIQTGYYDRRREFFKTISPSMDILVSSNLERLLYHLTGDPARVAAWMKELNETGGYDAGENMLARLANYFWAGWVDDAKTLETIKAVYEEYGYVLDTHTAVAWAVAEAYRSKTRSDRPMVIVSTASPYKFSSSVLEALGEKAAGKDAFAQLEALEEKNPVKAPVGLAGLKGLPVLHKTVVEKADMMKAVKEFAGK